jgi:hypothetical protein
MNIHFELVAEGIMTKFFDQTKMQTQDALMYKAIQQINAKVGFGIEIKKSIDLSILDEKIHFLFP